jgi:hypothetical protein
LRVGAILQLLPESTISCKIRKKKKITLQHFTIWTLGELMIMTLNTENNSMLYFMFSKELGIWP